MKANRDVFSKIMMHSFNEGIPTARFPNILKNTEVIFSSIDIEVIRAVCY